MKKSTIVIICVCVVLIPILLFSVIRGIIIISSGVMLHGTASDIAEDTAGTIDTLGKDAFNSQFAIYEGESVKATTVKMLINKVISNNENSGESKIKIEYKSALGLNEVMASSQVSELERIQNLLTNGQKYKVEISEYSKAGTVSKITITEM